MIAVGTTLLNAAAIGALCALVALTVPAEAADPAATIDPIAEITTGLTGHPEIDDLPAYLADSVQGDSIAAAPMSANLAQVAPPSSFGHVETWIQALTAVLGLFTALGAAMVVRARARRA